MTFPTDRLSLAHAAGSNPLSVWYGGTTPHSEGDNAIIDHVQGLEDAVGIAAADASQLPYLRFVDGAGNVLARGLVAYDATELPALLGRSTHELAEAMGPSYSREVVHRDDLALL